MSQLMEDMFMEPQSIKDLTTTDDLLLPLLSEIVLFFWYLKRILFGPLSSASCNWKQSQFCKLTHSFEQDQLSFHDLQMDFGTISSEIYIKIIFPDYVSHMIFIACSSSYSDSLPFTLL